MVPIFVWAGIIYNTISQGQHWKNENGQSSISLFNKNEKAKDKSSFSKYFTRLFTDIEWTKGEEFYSWTSHFSVYFESKTKSWG